MEQTGKCETDGTFSDPATSPQKYAIAAALPQRFSTVSGTPFVTSDLAPAIEFARSSSRLGPFREIEPASLSRLLSGFWYLRSLKTRFCATHFAKPAPSKAFARTRGRGGHPSILLTLWHSERLSFSKAGECIRCSTTRPGLWAWQTLRSYRGPTL